MVNILIVEDDASIVELLRFNLEKAGYNVDVAMDGKTAVSMSNRIEPDLILMDWMLPEQSGIDAVRDIRKSSNSYIPVIMLTARSEEDDKITSLDMGADDYIVKPFSPRELLARVRAILRRQNYGEDSGILNFKDIVIDVKKHTVMRGDKHIKMGIKEYNLLITFFQKPTRVFSREQLLDMVWGYDVYVETRTVDVHITRLRKALCGDNIIRTVWSVGYALVQDE